MIVALESLESSVDSEQGLWVLTASSSALLFACKEAKNAVVVVVYSSTVKLVNSIDFPLYIYTSTG